MKPKHNWQRVKTDVNGNSRYKVHFTVFVPDMTPSESSRLIAVERAKTIGGKPYRAKWDYDRIVFATCSLLDTERAIDEMLERETSQRKGNGMIIRPIVKMGSVRLSDLDVKIDLDHLCHTAAYVPPMDDAGDLDSDLLERIEWHDTSPPTGESGRIVWCNELMGSGYLEATILKAHFDSIGCVAHIGWDDCDTDDFRGWVVWHKDLGDSPQAYTKGTKVS